MSKREPINIMSLVLAIVTLIVGIILCFNDSKAIFEIVGYGVGGVLILTGIIRLLMTYLNHRKTNALSFGNIITSILLMALGGVIIIFPTSVMVTISICIGTIVIFIGIQRLTLGIAVKSIDQKGSLFFTIESLLIIIIGLIILSQMLTNLLGAFLIIYAISEMASYIYYTTQNKDYSTVLNKKVTKEMKESESKDAIIEEE